MKNSQNKKDITKRRKFYFKTVALILSLFILLSLELILRLFSVGDNLHLFIDHPEKEYSAYNMVNPHVGKKYFQKHESTLPRNDIFLKNKPESCFRIMVMGSSTVFGFPYSENLMYSRILQKMLEDTYPNQQFEVVNTAITAINSYTLLDYIDEVIEQEPDAILFYAGHNEFYGAFGIGSNETMSRNKTILNFHLKLMNLRIYQLVRKSITGIIKLTSNKDQANKGTLMKRIVKDKDIQYTSSEYKAAVGYFSDNLQHILQKVAKEDVPIFLSEVVSNIKDLKPFSSISNDTLDEALETYNLALKEFSDSNYSKARELFILAKDLDGVRFRASEDINRIIRSHAEEESIHLVPMIRYFEKEANKGIIGDELMTEHVHPNAKGYFVMANAFHENIVSSGLIQNTSDINSAKPLNYYLRNYGYTNLDILTGYHRVELLKHSWPFTNDYQEVNAYRSAYKPASYIDSVAFQIMKYSEINLADEHLKLAEIYEQQKNYYNAYREYETLLRINPYIAINYRDAANNLLMLSELPLALNYFNKSLEIEDSFFAQFKVGEIYLIMGDYQSAIKSFELAYKLAPEEKRINVMNKLFVATVYGNKQEKAQVIAQSLQKANPSIKLNLPPKQYNYYNYIPSMVKPEINEAIELLKTGNLDGSILILKESLTKWDSQIAKKYLGDIYIQKKDYPLANFYYNQVYQEYKFDPKFLHNNLLLYLTLNDSVKALNCLSDLKQIAPDYPAIPQLEGMLSK